MAEDGETVESDDLLGKVFEWVDTSGRALELRVHKRLRDAGYATGISVPYLDPTEQGKVREGDVQAVRPIRPGDPEDVIREALGRFILAIECKHSPGDPWVGFTTTSESRMPLALDAWSPAHDGLSDILSVTFGGLVPDGGICHDIANFKEKTSGGSSEPRNTAGDACRQVLSWARTLRPPDDLPYLVLAVVVTTHPLFVTTLDGDNTINAQRTGWFGCRRSLPGPAPEPRDLRGTLVHIVHEDSLGAFLSGVDEIYGQIAALLTSPGGVADVG